MARRRKLGLGLSLAALASPATARDRAQEPTLYPASDKFAARGGEIVAIINGQGDRARTFAPAFRKAIPDSQLDALADALREQLGRATGLREITRINANEARFVLVFERGTARAWLALSPEGARQVTGLRVTRIEPSGLAGLDTLGAVASAFAALPGRAGFLVQDLGQEAPQAALAKDAPLGVASAFKLVILAELVREIEAGRRSWDEEVTLDGREQPAGGFRSLPKGTRVSLRRLASEMIRVSDNSASDILLDTLGRVRVEAMQARLGFAHPERNVPFLKTMELFKLKGVDGGALGRRYLAADEGARRALLAGEVARRRGAEVGDLFSDGRPVMIERIEWFASPADLARALRWFRDQGASAAGREALRILAINPGPAGDLGNALAYAGYKGGSEPGVLSMAVLVKDKAGHWKAVVACANDPAHDVDLARFRALFVRALQIATGQLDEEA